MQRWITDRPALAKAVRAARLDLQLSQREMTKRIGAPETTRVVALIEMQQRGFIENAQAIRLSTMVGPQMWAFLSDPEGEVKSPVDATNEAVHEMLRASGPPEEPLQDILKSALEKVALTKTDEDLLVMELNVLRRMSKLIRKLRKLRK